MSERKRHEPMKKPDRLPVAGPQTYDPRQQAADILSFASATYDSLSRVAQAASRTASALIAHPEQIPAFYQVMEDAGHGRSDIQVAVPPAYIGSEAHRLMDEKQTGDPRRAFVHEVQGRIYSALADAAQEQARLVARPEGDAESERRLTALLDIIHPVEESRNRPQAEYLRRIGLEILRGYAEGCREEADIVNLMARFSTVALAPGNQHFSVLHAILTHAPIDEITVLPIRSKQAARMYGGRFSQDDETLRQSILLDYIISFLDERPGNDQDTGDRRIAIMQRENPEFNRIMRRLPTNTRQRTLQAFYTTQAEDQLEPPALEHASRPLPFPYSLTGKPSRLRTEYINLYTLDMLAKGLIAEPGREIAFPVDGLIRDITTKEGNTAELVRDMLRNEYAGRGRTLELRTDRRAIHDALTYLPPSCADMQPGIYNEAAIRVRQDGNDALRDRVRIDVGIGGYVIPLVLDAKNGLCFADGSRVDIEETRYEAWRQAVVSQAQAGFAVHRDNLLQSLTEHEGVLDIKETIDALLYTLRPHYMEQKQSESLAAEYNKAVQEIEHAERTFGLSPRGDMMKVKGVHRNRRITHASRILFDWGNQATTNIAVTIGHTVIPLRFDARYRLTHRDGSPLAVDPQTKIYWETVLMAHLHDRLLGTTRRTKDEGAPVGGEPKEHGESTQVMTPHRRRLPTGHRPTTEQSRRVAHSAWVRLNITGVPDEKLLEEYNRILGRDGSIDKPFYTWVVPHDDTIARCKQKPVEHDAPNALNAVAQLNLPEA